MTALEANISGSRIVGLDEFAASLDELTALLAAATGPATARAAHLLERRTKQALKQTAHKKGTKTPSAPGSPPSTVSGTLARSVQVDGPEEIGFGHYVAVVGPTVIYGRIQELGGTAGHGAVLAARPYLGPTADDMGPALRRIASQEWKKVIDNYRA